MIKLQVIGNLGKDALVNNVNGKTVINFNVAHTERYKDAQGNSYNFGYGLNWKGVIQDARTKKYAVKK